MHFHVYFGTSTYGELYVCIEAYMCQKFKMLANKFKIQIKSFGPVNDFKF